MTLPAGRDTLLPIAASSCVEGRRVKYITLVWPGIRRKRSRSVLILLQVVVAFALFGVLQGLTSAVNHAIASTHVDRLYVGSKVNIGLPLPIAIMPHVNVGPMNSFAADFLIDILL